MEDLFLELLNALLIFWVLFFGAASILSCFDTLSEKAADIVIAIGERMYNIADKIADKIINPDPFRNKH